MMRMFKVRNGKLVKGFTNEILVKLGFSEAEQELILNHQEKFPALMQQHRDSVHEIDMRNLWKQLGKPHGRFDKWMERKVFPYGFEEKVDFEVYDELKKIESDFQQWPIVHPTDKIAHRVKESIKSTIYDDSIRDTPYGYVGFHTFAHKFYERRPKIDYRFTIDAAKHVSLSEHTDIGKAFRQYFVVIEKAFRELADFESVRQPEKQGYIQLMESLERVYSPCSDKRKQQEANMLNRALMGLSAEEIRQRLEITDVWTRDHLQKRYNEVLDRLQQFDRALIESGVEFKDREHMIDSLCRREYAELKFDFNHIEPLSSIGV